MQEKTTMILNIGGCDSISSLNTTLGQLKPGTKLGSGQTPFPRIIK